MGLRKMLQRQMPSPGMSTFQLMILIAIVAVGSLAITVWLANDPNWAKWHISYLGEGPGFSADFFNYSMWLVGLLVFILSFSLGKDLGRLKQHSKLHENISPGWVQVGLALMAANVYLIGLFPRSYGILPHDIFGHAIYFIFLALCLASPWILSGMPKWFYRVSYVFHLLMLIVFAMYWLDVSDSLYLAEVATFLFFFAWVWLLARQARQI